MTKRVRVENADTSNYKVVVEVWEKSETADGIDRKVREIPLDYPTSMTGEDCYIHSGRYLVVKERV